MRILLIRPSAMGDVVMASLVLKALKDEKKGVEVHWLIDPALYPLLSENPFVDTAIAWDKALWHKRLKGLHLPGLCKEILTLKRTLRKKHYDLCLDLQGLFRSRLIAWLSGAPRRIGFESKEPGKFLMTEVISKGPPSLEMGSEYIYMMEYLGLRVKDPLPFVFVPERAQEKAEKILKAFGIKGPFAAFAPFTTRPQKHWIQERWQGLQEEIKKGLGIPVVVLGGKSDQERARAITGRADPWFVDLVGRTSILESAAIISMCSLLIGVDTGLTHMGTALKRPTVAIFGATRPYLETPSPRTKVLYKKEACSPCKRRPTCKGRFSCMEAITVKDVMEALNGVI